MNRIAENVTIRWLTRDKEAISHIRRRFKIPDYTTINGWSPAEIDPEDKELFDECKRRGFFEILCLKWRKNGGQYIFTSCK